jgi:hypothetical protein
MIHNEPSPYAGETVTMKESVPEIGGETVVVEDWWDRVFGASWTEAPGNPAAMIYGVRAGVQEVPNNDEVLYVKIENAGILININEIEGEED